MKRDQINKSIDDIISGDNRIELYFLDQPREKNNSYDCNIYQARLDKKLPKKILNTFIPKLQKVFIGNEYDIIEYDPTFLPDRDVIWIEDANIVKLFTYCVDNIENPQRKKMYDHQVLPYSKIWAFWIKIYGKNTYYIIKKLTPSKLVKTGGMAAIVLHDVFESLEEDILILDGSFDAFFIDGVLLFEGITNFERAFNYRGVKQDYAMEALAEIDSKQLVVNFDEMKEYIQDDYHSINKLNKMKSKEYFDELSISQIKQIIDQKDYAVDILFDEDENKFKIETKQQARQFIKILNDDYLMSEMTNNKYAANSKEPIKV